MTKDEALRLALEALETLMIERGSIYDQAITAIKEALAQPEPWEKFCDSNCVWTDHHPDCKLAQQEPVAWRAKNFYQNQEGWFYVDHLTDLIQPKFEPLYTTPPQRTWVGLTEDEVFEISNKMPYADRFDFAEAIEAKLKEKNT
jgi:hypothetical protein